MDNNFEKVSLGFAEFVSQLLHETFDAVLSAQNYQLEKYSEFEKALSLSNQQFKELYISDDEIKEKEIEIFGVSIKEKIQITNNLLTSIKRIIKDFDQEKAVEKNKLTNFGVTILEQKVIELIVDEKKEPIFMASIVIEGTTIGTTTDFDGNYTLETKSGTYNLIFSL